MAPHAPHSRLSRVMQVRLSDEDYLELVRVAEAAGVKLSEAVRLLTRWALLPGHAIDDEDATDPVDLLRSLRRQDAE